MNTARPWIAAGIVAFALASGGALAQGQPAAGYRPGEESIDVLPPGEGREAAFYACTVCHGTALIRAQGMSAERWDHTVQLMIDHHKMHAPDDADRRKIVAYLAQAFPPRAHPGGFTNPFLKK